MGSGEHIRPKNTRQAGKRLLRRNENLVLCLGDDRASRRADDAEAMSAKARKFSLCEPRPQRSQPADGAADVKTGSMLIGDFRAKVRDLFEDRRHRKVPILIQPLVREARAPRASAMPVLDAEKL